MASTPLSREERLKEYFRRLGAQPASHTADESLERIIRTLGEVEDEHSGIPKSDPPPPMNMPDGRMYPPQADQIVRNQDGGVIARTRGHDLAIGGDGSITIRNTKSGKIEFQQRGTGHCPGT